MQQGTEAAQHRVESVEDSRPASVPRLVSRKKWLSPAAASAAPPVLRVASLLSKRAPPPPGAGMPERDRERGAVRRLPILVLVRAPLLYITVS